MRKLSLSIVALFITAISFAQWTQNNPTSATDHTKGAKQALNPTNHALIMIDHEGQMAFAVESQPIEELRNNAGLIAGASKLFEIPTVITTVAEKQFSGPVFPEIREHYPDESKYVDRTTMNSWEDKNFIKAVEATGKKRLVMAGLWTEVCINLAALSALEDGYEVYVITDASGGVSKEAHDMSIARMIQAGVIPITSMQYMLEIYRDWARSDQYIEVNELAKRYGGAYGLGIDYIKTMQKWAKEEENK
ncbi:MULTISPECIES: hydrolase [Flavobacteriaceae]|uniref:hydrolase n=1 Tax=Flavobacteriaceae TaxID=49546 RepID=UPI001492BD2C|nr:MULTISPECIES: hydrolase [Allomuricauda]MDC6366202.1 hydrolase [Muricauda sp. AC10]